MLATDSTTLGATKAPDINIKMDEKFSLLYKQSIMGFKLRTQGTRTNITWNLVPWSYVSTDSYRGRILFFYLLIS